MSGFLDPHSRSSSTSSTKLKKTSSPDGNASRRARGPLNIRYVSRPAWRATAEEQLRCVQFAPWSPRTLTVFGITPSMIKKDELEPWQARWVEIVNEWNNVAAIVGSNGLFFLRLSTSVPHKVLLRIQEPGDEIYSVAWSYDPVKLQPIVAFSGRKNLIYVWRLGDDSGLPTERLRVLRGHGEEIYHLSFHPSHPHILASASKDTTIRLWNVLGQEPPPGAHKVPSLSQGNEGSLLVAVFVGQSPGGHLEGVTTLDFHPTLPLLATGGLDYNVKIWPLPKLPHPFATGAHKTYVCYSPLFSTKLLHDGIINTILWHAEDTLISYQQHPAPKAIKWQWMGLRRHFPLRLDGKPLIRYLEHVDGLGLQTVGSQYAESKSRSMNVLATFLPPIEAGEQRSLKPSRSPSPWSTSFELPQPFLDPEPLWLSHMARYLPYPNTSPVRPGTEITTSLIGFPLRGRVLMFNPDVKSSSKGFVPPLTLKQKKSVVHGSSGTNSPQAEVEKTDEGEEEDTMEEEMESVEPVKADSDIEVVSEGSSPVVKRWKSVKKDKQLKTDPAPQFEKPQEPYSILDCADIYEGEELIGVSVSPDGGKFAVGISRVGIHFWTLPNT